MNDAAKPSAHPGLPLSMQVWIVTLALLALPLCLSMALAANPSAGVEAFALPVAGYDCINALPPSFDQADAASSQAALVTFPVGAMPPGEGL